MTGISMHFPRLNPVIRRGMNFKYQSQIFSFHSYNVSKWIVPQQYHTYMYFVKLRYFCL